MTTKPSLCLPPVEACIICDEQKIMRDQCDHGHVSVLGEGTFGRVYLCTLSNGEKFVEKVLKVDTSMNFQREMHILRDTHHPNVVRLLGASDPTSARLTVRLEFCADGDLYHYIGKRRASNQPFTEEEVISYVAQLVLALQYLHTHSILHRDIKSGNIFLSNNYKTLKLGDFGCSFKSDVSIAEDQRRSICGTWNNLAPEVLFADTNCKAQYGKRAESWSLGVVLYEMMMLRPPFAWDTTVPETFNSMIVNITTGSFPPLSGYSKELCDLCASMLTVAKEGRPSIQRILSTPLVAAGAQKYQASESLQSMEERSLIAKQLLDVASQQSSVLLEVECCRVRTSNNEITPILLRITSSTQLLFRDLKRSSNEWSICRLEDCLTEDDEFETEEEKCFYGICIRPKKMTPITVGSFDKEQRDRIKENILNLIGKD